MSLTTDNPDLSTLYLASDLSKQRIGAVVELSFALLFFFAFSSSILPLQCVASSLLNSSHVSRAVCNMSAAEEKLVVQAVATFAICLKEL